MKKLLLIVMLFVVGAIQLKANDTIFNVVQFYNGQEIFICHNKYDRVLVYVPNGCTDYYFYVNSQLQHENPVILDRNETDIFLCEFVGCGITSWVNFAFGFFEPSVPTETTTKLWKHQHESISLTLDTLPEPPEYDHYEYLWNTSDTTSTIEITEPGTYTCGVSDMCATSIQTFIVQDNVEIYRSGVDPTTNKNKVRWNTTPEQAEYISSLKIERDGMVVGTVPYMDGEFLDNIGSENAARVYKITAIDTDGNECPLPSYQFGTFNTIISPDIANPSLMNFTWEDPFIEEGLPYSVIAYRIGRFNEDTGEFIMIDQLSANVHLGKYNMDLFGGDYGIVAAVFNDTKNRDYEKLAFSNRSDSGIVGIDELDNDNIKVYPNPANGMFMVEGTGILHITNALGQTIQTKEIDGKTIVELPQGLYFVKLNGVTQKIVVE